MSEAIVDINNFISGNEYKEINSPRSMEACLRQGLDPSELYPHEKESYRRKGMSDAMLNIAFANAERKRSTKLEDVKKERNAIIKYSMRASQSNPGSPNKDTKAGSLPEPTGGSNLVEQEEKRMEALKRRQEAELEKIMEREAALAELHQKIARAEKEEFKKKKAHEKAVIAAKQEAEKKAKVLAAKKASADEEEKIRRKEIERKEAAFAEKMKKIQAAEKRALEKEAKTRELERIAKMEEYAKKTEALIQQQADLAESNRIHMLEREQRVQAQMAEKREMKRIEVAEARARAKERIAAAIQKGQAIQDDKKAEFYARQAKAEVLAKEQAKEARIKNKETMEIRERKAKVAFDRLVGAYEVRKQKRQDIVDHRESRQGGYERMQTIRNEKIRRDKFVASLKVQDKIENVERTARVTEFRRLQTLKRIEDDDMRFNDAKEKKRQLMLRYRAEQKKSLTRKHEIADAMEDMRVTGDTKQLDKIFSADKPKHTAGPADDDEEGEKAATGGKPGTAS